MNFNDLTFLSRLSNIVQIVAIVLIFLGGGLQAYKFFLDKKIDGIKKSLEQTDKLHSEKTVSELQSKIGKQVQKIDNQAKEVETQRQKIQQQAEEVRKQQEKISEVESKTRPRLLTVEQCAAIRNGLRKQKGESIQITSVMGDQEALNFASQLKTLFQESGWTVDGVNQAVYTNPIKGIIITLRDKALEPKAIYVINLLSSVGYKSVGEINPQTKFDIGIVIGGK
jgi:hypothetical protein